MRSWPVTLFWSLPGEMSPDGCWVVFVGPYLYTGRTRLGAIWQAIRHWRDDRFLIG